MMKDKDAPFSIERRGYNRFQVEQQIKTLTAENARLEAEMEALKGRLATVILEKAELENKQALIEDTLINAEIAAREIIARAEEKAESFKAGYQEQLDAIDAKYAEKQGELKDTYKRIEYVLRSQLALIEANDVNDPGNNN